MFAGSPGPSKAGHFRSPWRRLRFLRDPFRAFFQKQNGGRGEEELQVGQHAHVIDIQQIELEFFIGVCVILAIDLGVAGQAGFDLEAEAEIRDRPAVFFRDFGAFRAGADEAHVPGQDIEKLGQLVHPAHPEQPSDPRDSIVLLPSAEPGEAVLFGVHPHRTELEDLKPFSVSGQAHLLIQGGPAVAEANRQGDAQHDGAQDHDADQGGRDVEQSFHNAVFRP